MRGIGSNSKVYTFLTQDVQNESESKELAVMIRLLDLVFALYFMFLSVTVAILEHYILSLVIVFSIGLLTGSFFCTYDNKTQASLIIFALVITLMSSYLTLVIGYANNYYWLSFVAIMVVFFNLDRGFLRQFRRVIIIGVVTAASAILSCYDPVIRDISVTMHSIIIFINILVMFICVILIANFFRAKFMLSEQKIIQYNKKLVRMASIDALTNLYNRRHMNDYLKELAVNSAKTNRVFSIAIGDVDLFKSINDTYGHDIGDEVLVTISTLFLEYMKDKGIACRWGGEEFLLVFENTDLETSYILLERLRKMIFDTEFTSADNKIFHVSMTFGVEEYDEHKGIEMVISRADTKLYIGKKDGRNKVIH